jgi:hypothetical protein
VIHLKDGPFNVRLSPVNSGATVVRFAVNAPVPKVKTAADS